MAEAEKRPGSGHERNDVSTRGVLMFAVFLVIGSAVVSVAMWGLFRLLAHESKSSDRPLPPMVEQSLKRVPPSPQLENKPRALRSVLNAQEDARLSSYGWVDRNAGQVHIPISRAMELLAERGIAETKGAPGAAGAAGSVVPGPSSGVGSPQKPATTDPGRKTPAEGRESSR